MHCIPRRLQLLEETARLRADDLARDLGPGADDEVRSMRDAATYADMSHISSLVADELDRLLNHSLEDAA